MSVIIPISLQCARPIKLQLSVPHTLRTCKRKEELFDALDAYHFRKSKLDA
jgi:hypothetical protein